MCAQTNVVELKEEEIKIDREIDEVDGEEKEERSREKGGGAGRSLIRSLKVI